MTKDEALKLALEALENMSAALREDDVLGSDSELMLNAITAIKEALEECDEDELIIRYHEMTIKRLEKRIEELTVQPEQVTSGWSLRYVYFDENGIPLMHREPEERNFCPRCGKRTADLTTIHTCTPPRNAA
jgi:hypothetical protein